MDDPLIKRLESNRIPTGVDPRQYYRRYLENSPRLFIARGNVEHVEVFRVLIEKQCQEPSDPNEMRIMGAAVELRQAENYDVLEKEIRINRLTAQHSLYLLQQGHSWDRFRISEFSLERILTAHHVFLPFFDLIQAYGVKNHEDHHNWTGHRSYISKEPAVKDEEFRYEFCYNLQYMEKNNRRKGDPWSLRQSGVYQQISVSSRRSTWIILQPSNGVRAQLEQALENSLKQGRESDESAIYFHVIFLSSMAGNWQEYLEYLHSQIIAFDEKACFSRVGVEYDHEDYALTFSDCQNLQLLRQKLLRTSSVLDACLDVTSGCADHCIRLTNMKLADPSGRGLSEIVYYKRQLLQHRQTIGRITQQAAEAGRLLSKILEFRNDKTLQTTLSILQNLFSESREDHKLLLELARQSQKDSRTLKAFSSVATMYLPASLIATIFSSSLIRTELDVTNSDSPHYFAVSSKFWLFFLSSVSLSFLTFAFIMLVQRIWQRHSELLNGRSQP